MSLYNRLSALVTCPRCGVDAMTMFECHFGYRGDMADLQIGDTYPWSSGDVPGVTDEMTCRVAEHGGIGPGRVVREWRKAHRRDSRPPAGNCDGRAYAECPSCEMDYHASVGVRANRIASVQADCSMFPFIPDAVFDRTAEGQCLACSGMVPMDLRLFAGFAKPGHIVGIGASYEPCGRAGVSAELWAEGRCHELHESVFVVRLVDGIIEGVAAAGLNRRILPSELGRRKPSAGPIFLRGCAPASI